MPHSLLTALLEAHGRNVAGNMARVQHVATVMLCLSIWHSNITSITATVAARITTTAAGISAQHSSLFNASADSEIIVGSAALNAKHGGEIIGATSLAAAAGAAEAMATENAANAGGNNSSYELRLPLDTVAAVDSGINAGPFGVNIGVIVDRRIGDINKHDGDGAVDSPTLTHITNRGNDEIFSSSANLLLELTGNIVNLTRQHNGDIFQTAGEYSFSILASFHQCTYSFCNVH